MVAKVYRAMQIAAEFVKIANQHQAALSNLKLQKLLYYAQGRSLAVNGTRLFREPIEAWDHGPVVSDVYHACKGNGSQTVEIDPSYLNELFELDRDTRRILDAVWSEEGSKAAWVLREQTHKEAPWRDHYLPGLRHVEIPIDAISDYFREQHLAPSLSIESALEEWVEESRKLAEEFLPATEDVEW
ncbi:SocA family protein [Nocardia farcinica]|uniref:Panacea domain-containing protein n=1 Tax=Nocardia farcinica TaxID=37329 RepID=UPI0018943548|nr:type II toxin-antitoxin system antitoxin SocA domain-containing protein [Nocardia farcinica]MBF6388273.1 SocA family protein [Nocardia farcinica]MBF6421837.1 SocA family protein [Nocardia farcinica]MBF6433494.1 SocA family protein [Nocardia farcinica]MBF6504379.1 SocA family protein [Nocardia farcinica]MBF6541237.1 SocA family protein [Nocardia farcinica]